MGALLLVHGVVGVELDLLGHRRAARDGRLAGDRGGTGVEVALARWHAGGRARSGEVELATGRAREGEAGLG
jgi:hypothetical protein